MSDDGVRVDMPHIFKWFQSTANVERLAIKSNHSSFNYKQIYLRVLLLNTNEKTGISVCLCFFFFSLSEAETWPAYTS